MKSIVVMDFEDVVIEVTRCSVLYQYYTDCDEEEADRAIESAIMADDKVFLEYYRAYEKDQLEKMLHLPNFFRNLPFTSQESFMLYTWRKDLNIYVRINDKRFLEDKIYYLTSFLYFKPHEIILEDNSDILKNADCYIASDIDRLKDCLGEPILFNYLHKPIEDKDLTVIHNWPELIAMSDEFLALMKYKAFGRGQENKGNQSLKLETICTRTDNFTEALKGLNQEEMLKIVYFNEVKDQNEEESRFTEVQELVHLINDSKAAYQYVGLEAPRLLDGEKILIMNVNEECVGILGTGTVIGNPVMTIEYKYGLQIEEYTPMYQALIKIEALRSIFDPDYIGLSANKIEKLDLDLMTGDLLLGTEFNWLLGLSHIKP